MTDLTKPVKRVSRGKVFESGKLRDVVVILMPPKTIGFRAKGCKKTYYLPIGKLYTLAVDAHVLDKKRQKALAKARKTKKRKRI